MKAARRENLISNLRGEIHSLRGARKGDQVRVYWPKPLSPQLLEKPQYECEVVALIVEIKDNIYEVLLNFVTITSFDPVRNILNSRQKNLFPRYKIFIPIPIPPSSPSPTSAIPPSPPAAQTAIEQ